MDCFWIYAYPNITKKEIALDISAAIDNHSKSAGMFMKGIFFTGFLAGPAPGDRGG
jgi:hypothetical protein